jgi:phenylpropionate dioxygenase-like ring-hydroxylating dioxygenase large terminal subunit
MSGTVVAMDPYCPHMGAHLKEGKVLGDQIVCAFHGWEFNSGGKCTKIPCQKYADKTDAVPVQGVYPVREQYGLIWIYSGRDAGDKQVPFFAELVGEEVEILVGHSTFRPCRPEVVMLNAIDAHHFNTVHPEASKLAGNMDLKPVPLSREAIRLENQTAVPRNSLVGNLLAPFYKKDILTYYNDYWYGSTGVVTLGPDFLHFYLLFPHRPTEQGGTEGTMVFLTKKRKGLLGKLLSRTILWVTYIVGTYFEKGDREIFASIQFDMKAPVKADLPIIEFIRHTERQAYSPLASRPSRRRLPRGETEKVRV